MEKKLNVSIFDTKKIVSIGLLSSISIFLGLSGLGFIPIPPVKATILHVPVIIGAILDGPIVGMIIGLFFGLFSMYNALVTMTPTSFVFLNPIIALIPRIMIGLISYYVYTILCRFLKNKYKAFSVGAAAVCGSLINTAGVLGLAYFIYLDKFSKALGLSATAGAKAISLVAATNGIPEAIVSALITIPIIAAAKKVRRK